MRYIFIFLMIFHIRSIVAQMDKDSIPSSVLDTIWISDTKNNNAVEDFGVVQPITSNLNMLTSINFLQSGASHLGTIQYRGLSSRHTQIQWQGVHLSSATNGVYDYQLLPTLYFNNIQFNNDGETQKESRSSLGGNFVLQSSYEAKSIGSVNIGMGNNYQLASKSVSTFKNLTANIGAEYTHNQNNYSYSKNTILYIAEKSALQNLHLNTDINFDIDKSNKASLHAWFQESDREIPSFLPNGTLQFQTDKNLRLSSSFVHHFKELSLSSKLAFLSEKLDFTTAGVDSRSKVNTIQGEIRANSSKLVNVSINIRKDVATPNFFIEKKERTDILLMMDKRIELSNQWHIYTRINPQWVDGKSSPFAFHTALHYAKNKNEISIKVERNLQIPSLNDLYWPQGGDADLANETSSKIELSMAHSFIQNHTLHTNIYYQNVQNFIQWAPQSNGLWKAFNRKNVLARGIELMSKSIWLQGKKHSFKTTSSYSYSLATTENDIFSPSANGKQLPYIPLHKASIIMQFGWQYFSITCMNLFQDKRYETPDHFSSLPSFYSLNIAFAYTYKKVTAQLFVENVTNINYSLQSGFPRPLRRADLRFTYMIK